MRITIKPEVSRSFLSGIPGLAKRNCNSDDDSDSRRPERTPSCVSMGMVPKTISVALAVLAMVLVIAVPTHGFSTVPAAAAAAAAPEKFRSGEDCVKNQLGYLPSNYVGVSAWKKQSKGSRHRDGVRIATTIANVNGTANDEGHCNSNINSMIPVAIQTYPLNGGAKRRQNKAKLSTTTNPRDTGRQQHQTTKPSTATNKNQKKSIVQSPFPTLFWLTCPDISRAVANLEGRGFVKIFEDTLNSDAELSQRLFACHEEYARLRWRSLTEDDRNVLECCSSTTTTTKASSNLTPSLQRMRNMMECSGISGTNFTDISSWDSDYSERAAAAAATTTTVMAQPNNNNNSHENEATQQQQQQPGVVLQSFVPKVPPIKCLHAHYAHYRSTVSVDSTRHINPVGELIHRQLQLDFPDLDL